MRNLKIRRFRIALIILFILPINLFAQNDSKIIIGEKYNIHSHILNEEREYWMYLPGNYYDAANHYKKYPVLVLLDGDRHFHATTGVIEYMSKYFQIPEMIVVAILNTDRTRDMTPTHTLIGYGGTTSERDSTSGGADQFLQFIANELLKSIETDFRTMPYRMLVGHSYGGLLAVHSFLAPEPVFNAYIAIDPSLWWNNQVLTRVLDSDSIAEKKFSSRLYISAANNSSYTIDTTEMRRSQEAFFIALEKKGKSPLPVKFQYFNKDDHGSIPLPSLYHGLLYIFDGYKMENIERKSFAEIQQHYESLSERLGMSILPPEKVINNAGYIQLYENNDVDTAIKLFTYNMDNYPESFNVYDSFAEALKIKGNKEEAIENYKKSLELNPNNENAKKVLKELMGE